MLLAAHVATHSDTHPISVQSASNNTVLIDAGHAMPSQLSMPEETNLHSFSVLREATPDTASAACLRQVCQLMARNKRGCL